MAVLAILVLCFMQMSLVTSRRWFRDDRVADFQDLWYEDGYDRMLKDNTIQQDEATDTVTALKGIFEKFPADRKAVLTGKLKEAQNRITQQLGKGKKAQEAISKTLEASVIQEIKGITGDGAADSLVGITASLGGLSMNKQIEILKAVIVAASTLPMKAQKKIAIAILVDYLRMPTARWGWRNEPRDALLKPLATGMFPKSTSSEKEVIFQKIEDDMNKEIEKKGEDGERADFMMEISSTLMNLEMEKETQEKEKESQEMEKEMELGMA